MKKRVSIGSRPASVPSPSSDQWVSGTATATPKRKRLTLDLPTEMHQRLKIEAARHGTTILALVIEALTERYGESS
jgi:predicted HicB family RNase H-like nuclease